MIRKRQLRRAAYIAVLASVMVLGGCASTTPPTVPSASTPAGATVAPPPTSTAAARTNPVVSFVNHETGLQAGNWPFTAQLTILQTDVNGFGAGATHAQNQTYLMVQVAVTDQMPGQLPPIPMLDVACKAPGRHRIAYNTEDGTHGPLNVNNSTSWGTGWDGGPSSDPDPTGVNVPMGDGQPHDWDEEWLVPASFAPSNVTCRLDNSIETDGGTIRVTGSGRLN